MYICNGVGELSVEMRQWLPVVCRKWSANNEEVVVNVVVVAHLSPLHHSVKEYSDDVTE